MEAHLEVRFADQSKKRYGFSEDQITVGSSPTAGIPLVNAFELLPEHLLLAPRADGCWVSVAQGSAVPVMVDGRPIEGELLPWDSELAIGNLTVWVRKGPVPGLTLLGGSVDDEKPETTGDRVRRMGILLLGVGAFTAFLFLTQGGGGLRNTEAEPPPLFDHQPGGSGLDCPEGNPAHLAQTLADEAAARMDRYPFDAREGILAVQLYDQSGACFQQIRQPEARAAFHTIRDQVATRIEDDFRSNKLMLERSLETERYYEALLAVRTLSRLLQHREESAYSQWVFLLERRLLSSLEAQEDE